MLGKVYSARNYASVALHYTIVGGLAACAVAFGQPWAIAVGVGVTAAITPRMTKAAKRFLENELKEHPDTHDFSPNLRQTVDDLSREAGMDIENGRQKIFSFKPKQSSASAELDIDNAKGFKAKRRAFFDYMMRKTFEEADKTPNAAASNFGKPVIIISEKLLELLDDDEQKAVLAHEFTHAAAEHQRIAAPKNLVSSAAKLSNKCMVLMAYVQTGFVGFISSLGTSIAAGVLFVSAHPKGNLVTKKPTEVDVDDWEEVKNVKRLSSVFSSVAMAGTMTYFNPAFLPIYLGATSMNVGLNLTEKSMSRSQEFQADKGAVLLGASPLALITSLRKMEALVDRSKCNFLGVDAMPKKGELSKMWSELNATHPATEKRVARLADIARESGFKPADIDKAVSGPVDIKHVGDISRDVFQAMNLFVG